MSTGFFISHPDVEKDPKIPVPQWHLNDRGIARMRQFSARPELRNLSSVWASTQTKAIEAAGILAARFGLSVQVHPGLGENDRSATGFLPAAEFENTANLFFADPDRNVRGWETARHAQSRVLSAIADVLSQSPGDVAIVSHGGVGTLALCAFLGEPISRSADQPFEGHFWSFDRHTRRVLHRWLEVAPR